MRNRIMMFRDNDDSPRRLERSESEHPLKQNHIPEEREFPALSLAALRFTTVRVIKLPILKQLRKHKERDLLYELRHCTVYCVHALDSVYSIFNRAQFDHTQTQTIQTATDT